MHIAREGTTFGEGILNFVTVSWTLTFCSAGPNIQPIARRSMLECMWNDP